jgi:hypothetical protein
LIEKKAPHAKLEDDGAGSLIYHFPIEQTAHIPAFVKFLDLNEMSYFKAWGISQTSLEQIFLRVVRLSQNDDMINGEE